MLEMRGISPTVSTVGKNIGIFANYPKFETLGYVENGNDYKLYHG